jgi:adenylate cyclase
VGRIHRPFDRKDLRGAGCPACVDPAHVPYCISRLERHGMADRDPVRAALQRNLSRYVSAEVAEQLLRPSVETPQEVRTTILAVRIAGFERLATAARHPELPALMNRYVGLVHPAVSRHRGILEDALGCRVQASFGPLIGPVTPLEALRAALAILEREPLEDSLKKRLRELDPEAGLALGLATGPCLVGNFGSERRAFWCSLGEAAERARALCAAARALDPTAVPEAAAHSVAPDGRAVYSVGPAITPR